MKILNRAILLLSYLFVYLISWMIAYIVFMQNDMKYYFEYFILAWTFNGLEYPSGIWLLSIVIFILLVLLFKVIIKYKKAAA